MKHKIIAAVLLCATMQIAAMGQVTTQDFADRINILTPAVPFLTISMGPAINGLITTVPDGTSGPGIYGNPGLLALDSGRFRSTIDYVPWHRDMIPDISLVGLGGCYRLNDKHSIGASFRYFSLGTLTVTTGGATSESRLWELAGSLLYTYNIDKYTGIGVDVKYIHSHLFSGDSISNIKVAAGKGIAMDIGFAKQFPGRNGKVDQFLGISLNNVGTKISYSQNAPKIFIPTTLAAGYGVRVNIRGKQSISLSYEGSKLLIPTPPVYYPDSLNQNQDPVIQAGYDPNVGVFRGMIQSFYDAPGGYREELHEIIHSVGLVYRYKNFTAGAGYNYVDHTKGNHQFISCGLSGNFKFGPAGKSRIQTSISCQVPFNTYDPYGNIIHLGINFSI
jgi:hypothetical protein